MDSNKQNLINKILYRSQYRGTKEMDFFVSKFVKSIINDLNLEELSYLNKLINLDDEELIKASIGEYIEELDNNIVINKLIEFKKNY